MIDKSQNNKKTSGNKKKAQKLKKMSKAKVMDEAQGSPQLGLGLKTDVIDCGDRIRLGLSAVRRSA